jgi:uncharacterized protein YxeA
MFTSGIVVGAGVSWIYHKNKYEEMVQEEVESLRERSKKKEVKTKVSSEYGETKKEEECDYMAEENRRNEEYEVILHNNNYIYGEPKNKDDRPPFIVTPQEFSSLPEFDTDTLYYYINDIIANDSNEIVDDVERILGMSAEKVKEQFGVYEDDSVFIRNIQLKCDYEILREDTEYLRRNGD